MRPGRLPSPYAACVTRSRPAQPLPTELDGHGAKGEAGGGAAPQRPGLACAGYAWKGTDGRPAAPVRGVGQTAIAEWACRDDIRFRT